MIKLFHVLQICVLLSVIQAIQLVLHCSLSNFNWNIAGETLSLRLYNIVCQLVDQSPPTLLMIALDLFAVLSRSAVWEPSVAATGLSLLSSTV